MDSRGFCSVLLPLAVLVRKCMHIIDISVPKAPYVPEVSSWCSDPLPLARGSAFSSQLGAVPPHLALGPETVSLPGQGAQGGSLILPWHVQCQMPLTSGALICLGQRRISTDSIILRATRRTPHIGSRALFMTRYIHVTPANMLVMSEKGLRIRRLLIFAIRLFDDLDAA